MIYLNIRDLEANAFKDIIAELVKDSDIETDNTGENPLDKCEIRRIEKMKSLLKRYYDTDAIFNADHPVRNEVLISILSRQVLFDLVRRNARRKVPADFKENSEAADKELLELNKGIVKLDDLPPKPGDEAGGTSSNAKILYGNLSNPDFYI